MDQGKRTISFDRRHFYTFLLGIALTAVVLPRAVEAATGTAVNITDPDRAGRQAGVTAAGRLQTSVCDADSCAAVDSGAVRIAGRTFPGIASSYVQGFKQVASNVDTSVIGAIPINRKLAITSVTVTNRGAEVLELALRSADQPDAGLPCDEDPANADRIPSTEDLEVHVPVGDTVHLSFPQPWIAPVSGTPNTPWCLIANPFAGSYAVSVVGYLIPA